MRARVQPNEDAANAREASSINVTPLLTLRDVRQRLNVGMSTVYQLVESRRLRAAKVQGQWRVKAEDLEAYIESRMQAPAVTPPKPSVFDADRELPKVAQSWFS